MSFIVFLFVRIHTNLTMKKIQMVDLQSQYAKIQEQVDSKISEVLKSAAYINGPEVHAFQKNLEIYLGVKNVIPCANGTDGFRISTW